MDIIISDVAFGAQRVSIVVYDSDVESTVFRASLESGVEVFFELDAGFELWDVLRAASDSFKVEFDLLRAGS